jgi:hypothetical protein
MSMGFQRKPIVFSMGSGGISAAEFRIVHKGVSDCINLCEKPRDSGFAEDEIENPLKHPVAVELVDATPSQEDCKKYCNNPVAH